MRVRVRIRIRVGVKAGVIVWVWVGGRLLVFEHVSTSIPCPCAPPVFFMTRGNARAGVKTEVGVGGRVRV